MKELLQDLYQFLFNQPRVIREEADAITPVFAKWMARLDTLGDTSGSASDDADHTSIARDVGDWLLEYFEYVYWRDFIG